eukprot:COSAG05_NODE_3764_length_1851_cov_1.150685_1_plen_564_part_00
MAGIVLTALSLPATDLPPRSLDIETLGRRCSLTFYTLGSAVTLCGFTLGQLSLQGSCVAAILLGTAATLLAGGNFGGPLRHAGHRLRTPEFALHYFWILWVMSYIFSDCAAHLRRVCLADAGCLRRLDAPWLPSYARWYMRGVDELGMGFVPSYAPLHMHMTADDDFRVGFVDRSDVQWAFFAKQIPLLSAAALGFLALASVARKRSHSCLLSVYCLGGVAFLVIVHGVAGALFYAAFAAVNYARAKSTAAHPRLGAAAPWVLALLFLSASEWLAPRGLYDWTHWLPAPYGETLQRGVYNGMAPRWWVYAGPSLLRMLSFSQDFRQAVQQSQQPTTPREQQPRNNSFLRATESPPPPSKRSASPARQRGHRGTQHSATPDPSSRGELNGRGAVGGAVVALSAASEFRARLTGPPSTSYRARCNAVVSLDAFGLVEFWAYVFYLPTLLAGPILPFAAFYSQTQRPQTAHSASAIAWYAGGGVIGLSMMEVLTHAAPVMAVASSGAHTQLALLPVMCFCFVLLKAMWLKFWLIWRFFRLWALLDGVETPENMGRCMSDNYRCETP